MRSQMSLFIIAFLAIIISNVTADVLPQNNLIVGELGDHDQLLERRKVEESFSLGIKKTISELFEGDRQTKITHIRALDQHENGHGAVATIKKGGIGLTYVEIEFESQPFRGIDFIVEIYGSRT
ncbi:probable salivary secreted peptide [Copidosoma floridanum]|uniref:probable salivary secreted peptide n=1 Tax=Copidosoma floridanum TaxID=29053 RepID=UPI0006C97AC0|nr:probable salivary secreted peptide [Copidosoma floridanum]